MICKNKVRSLALLALILCVASSITFAEPEVAIGAIRMETEANVPGVPGDTDDSLEAKVSGTEDRKQKKYETVIAPIPSRNPLLGWVLGVPVMVMYTPANADPQDQVWITGAFGFYTENDSWGAGLFQRSSFGGDKWRVMGALFHADVNYDYYGIGSGGDDRSILLSQPTTLVMAEALRRIAPSLYVGLRAVYAETEVRPDIPAELLPPWVSPEDLRIDFTISTLNPRLQYDTRDSEFYPRNGYFIDADVAISRQDIGADADYEKYDASVNNYLPLGQSGVLASRVNVKYADNDAPFFVYPAFGMGADLRGYQTGTYRDRFLIAAQAEYRHRFTPKIGAVAFAGVGSVAPDFAEWGTTLPSVGVGFRWVIAPKNNVGLRVDFARGRDESIFYVGIGEAF